MIRGILDIVCGAVLAFIEAMLLIVIAVFGHRSPQKQRNGSEDRQRTADGGHYPSDPTGAVQDMIDTAIQQNSTGGPNQTEHRHNEQHGCIYHAVTSSTFWVALFTGLLVLCSAIGFVFQWNALRVARDSANAARDAVELASDNAEKQLRAYVYISALTAEKNEDHFNVHIKLTNVGHTPASEIVWGNWLEYMSGSDAVETVKHLESGDLYEGTEDEARDSIAATDSLSLSDNCNIMGDNKKETEPLWMYGIAAYEDVFGNRMEISYLYKVSFNGKGKTILERATQQQN
jgi:hypothetical protein